jgi:fructosamine-3-kinase
VTGDFGTVAAAVAAATGRRVAAAPDAAVGGGSIHAAYRWPTAAGPLFVKLAPAADAPLLAAEAHGLGALAAARAIRVPAVLGTGVAGEAAWLALEWLALAPAAPAAPAAEQALGERLATLHGTAAERFGFAVDNFIGRTPQPNGWCDDWPEFLALRRLGPQLALAAEHGHGGRLTERGARLLEVLGAFYADYRPRPSLLHGDLWGGNRGALADGTPVVFDPAPYYGDREADLAMTRLFGGFGARFYAAYEARWPLDAGAGARVGLHQLYHVLNHLNLFGGGYARQALVLTERLLATAGG